MALLSIIRRWHLREEIPIREIERRTGLSRNTIRKYLRSGAVEPKFKVPDRPSNLDPFADRLEACLRVEAGKSRKQRRTARQMHNDLLQPDYPPRDPRAAFRGIENRTARGAEADRDRLQALEDQVAAINTEALSKYQEIRNVLREKCWNGRAPRDRLVIFSEKVATDSWRSDRLREGPGPVKR